MKTIALVSGGKDSILSILLAMRLGYEPAVIAHVQPAVEEESEDVNSYMFQTVGSNVVCQIAECCNVPLRVASVKSGQSKDLSLHYSEHPDEGDEVETLFQLLKSTQEEFPEVTAVTSGAILSNYQRLRVESICGRLGLLSVACLWMRAPHEILDMVKQLKVNAVLVKTASIGLKPKELIGKQLLEARQVLLDMETLYGSHPAGEGGEYETVVVDCPLFATKRLTVEKVEVVVVDENEYSPSGYGVLTVATVEKSEEDQEASKKVLGALLSGQITFPSDQMKYLATIPEDAMRETLEEGTAVVKSDCGVVLSNLSQDCPGVLSYDQSFSLKEGAGMASILRAISEDTRFTSALCCVVVVLPEDTFLPELVTSFNEAVPHVRPPMRLFCVSDNVYRNDVLVKVLYSEHPDQATVLHNQSRSAWAAGRVGPIAEGWKLQAANGSTTVVSGVYGIHPLKGDVVTRTSDTVQDFFIQFSYALANALQYLNYFSENCFEFERVFIFAVEAFSSFAESAWTQCSAHCGAKVTVGELVVVPVTSLELPGAVVSLHLERVTREEKESDESD